MGLKLYLKDSREGEGAGKGKGLELRVPGSLRDLGMWVKSKRAAAPV